MIPVPGIYHDYPPSFLHSDAFLVVGVAVLVTLVTVLAMLSVLLSLVVLVFLIVVIAALTLGRFWLECTALKH